MSTRPKQKEISGAQAKGLARGLKEGLSSGDGWQESFTQFENLSAGNRKAVVEAIKQSASGSSIVDATRLLELALCAVQVGPSSKADFVLALLQSTVEMCVGFGQTGVGTSAQVVAALLTGNESSDAKLPDAADLDLARLAQAPAAGRVVSELLEDAGQQELLKGSIQAWGPLVAALVATKGTSCEVRPAAAAAALKLMADPAALLPVDLVLSANWLCQIAGDVPDELRKRSPFQSLLDSPRANAIARDPVGEPRSDLLLAIGDLVKRHETEVEERRAALSAEVARLRGDLERTEKDRDAACIEASELQAKVARIREEKQSADEVIRTLVDERSRLELEIEKWKKEAQVLLDSRNHQIDQAKSDCRREFTRAASTNLKSLRGFVLELKQSEKTSPGSLAVAALDEVIRVLHRQHFFSPEELPRVQ